ncbi:hypothetical protein [Paenibacillus glycanilyticus]|uniref:Uncharacterized protein n=1 Tax=Paenibacillus glycanilyticus TaxID=126569 RepID=A0ABQ6GH46_9BACL|nr:hypothetical protein [Paenibacillus glycanilyticus]GLX68636.1 hypothetical protein MU1_29810 [Paenibacillus glycanilyticus]
MSDASIYEILSSFPLGEVLAVVSIGSVLYTNAVWAGFYEGNARFISAGLPVYIPLSKIRYITR